MQNLARQACRREACRIAACFLLATISRLKNRGSHIDASLSRQPLVKGERLVRLEVNAVMQEQSELLSTGGKAEDGNSLTS